MTVKIDMEMPKSCKQCRFRVLFRQDGGTLCLAAQEVFIGTTARKIFCPLKPVEGE